MRFLPTVIVSLSLFITFRPEALALDSWNETILPLLHDYCLTCHSTEKQEGEFDLEKLTQPEAMQRQPEAWQGVLEQLTIGEMPPKDARQLSRAQKQTLIAWVRRMLDELALANAGDPGPVILRRLSNREYTYTLRDLTGIETLDPAREFPVDGAAGEGFTNVGAALVMSPTLLQKYLDAAKEVASHTVLLPDGIRFSASDSPQDWTDEALSKLRNFYTRYTVPSEITQEVVGAGSVKNTGGAIPLTRYLDALQGRGRGDDLSPKYLTLLERALTASEPSLLLDPLRRKYAARTLTAEDIHRWQKVLWKFNTVGHIGRPNGPKAWQEPADPLVSQRELRVPLPAAEDTTVYLIAGTAGDGAEGDTVLWENPRLVAKGRPDIPLGNIDELVSYLEDKRTQLLADTEQCLVALEVGNDNAPVESLSIWREFLGFGTTQLEPLLSQKVNSLREYDFIRGWRGPRDLSVLANSSDSPVRIPGYLPGHSVATHPAPDLATVVAWKSPVSANLVIRGTIVDAHPECGNGVTWSLEVRRGSAIEPLASGVSKGAQTINFGPFEDVRLQEGQVVALVVGPRDGDHSCDLTRIDLTISDRTAKWNLTKEVSPDILVGNPHGPWHFLSQPATANGGSDLPASIAAWRQSPSTELAVKVREQLEEDFPLNHPLLLTALKSFHPSSAAPPLVTRAPSVHEITIPASLSQGSEFVVTGKLAAASQGSVQLQALSQAPTMSLRELSSAVPVMVGPDSEPQQKIKASFDEFRALFPSTLCYTTIVPIDEVVTFNLYHREDEALGRLMLSEAELQELDRLWSEFLFIAEAPLKQVAAFEQITQFATQDRADLANEFTFLQTPIRNAVETFRQQQREAEPLQRKACLELAAKAWRRPLTASEVTELEQYPPRLLLTRVLTSPSFLYRAEQARQQTGPVNDWELATRLSYFLWSSLPDEELRLLAASGQLRNPEVLAKQARRMLKDEKVRRLATEFACQWLHVRDVATLDEKSERHFPTFVELRDEMQEEVTRFFVDWFQNDGRVLELLDADHTFVNKALAAHYDLSVAEDGWQRVEGLRAKGRGGILGFAATLAKHAGASRTSAILRGTWLSEVILGDKLPNPPKGVPVLPEEPPAGLTERQLIELHSSDERCSACHQRIDPYGFALEGFDAIGRARLADTKTILQDGTAIAGLEGLRTYLITQRKGDFVKQFSRKLLGYALGRSAQLSDEPLLDALSAKADHPVGALIEMIVQSDQFREIRGQTLASTP